MEGGAFAGPLGLRRDSAMLRGLSHSANLSAARRDRDDHRPGRPGRADVHQKARRCRGAGPKRRRSQATAAARQALPPRNSGVPCGPPCRAARQAPVRRGRRPYGSLPAGSWRVASAAGRRMRRRRHADRPGGGRQRIGARPPGGGRPAANYKGPSLPGMFKTPRCCAPVMDIQGLEEAVMSSSAIRRILRLLPVGGDGSYVAPPTYLGDQNKAVHVFRGAKD